MVRGLERANPRGAILRLRPLTTNLKRPTRTSAIASRNWVIIPGTVSRMRKSPTNIATIAVRMPTRASTAREIRNIATAIPTNCQKSQKITHLEIAENGTPAMRRGQGVQQSQQGCVLPPRTHAFLLHDKKWNDPLNWHTRDGHTLRERKQQWREESDIPGSFSAWP